MAWTEAARKAAIEARRRKRSAVSDFHYGGTPAFNPHSVSKDYRKRLAQKLKDARAQLKMHPTDFHAKHKMGEVMWQAGHAQGMRTHWANDTVTPKKHIEARRYAPRPGPTPRNAREHRRMNKADFEAGQARQVMKKLRRK